MIHVEKVNEAQLRVYSEDFGIEQELCEHFCFYVHGYRFMPQFKAKIWDGKARLYDIHRKTLPNGLLEYLRLFAKNNDYPLVEQKDLRPEYENVSIEELLDFIDDLNIHARGVPIELRDYQIDAIYQAINREKILTLSPTSSGKSVIIYVVIRWQLAHNRRTILMVPTTSLVSQMLHDFKDYACGTDWDADEYCHTLYSGQIKSWHKPVLITTWQSVHSMTKNKTKDIADFYKSWNCYIGDEAHRFASNSLQQISNRMVNARWRIGTTGTIQDDKVSKLSLEGSFGPVYRVVTTKQLMENKQVVDLRIKCITLEHPLDIRKLFKSVDYQKEMDYITTNEKRNEFIAKLAKATNGNTLVLFQYVGKHGKPLYELIKSICKDRPVFYISGETNVGTREDIRTGVENYKNAIIVASVATVATGTNIPSIENIIFASPAKSRIRNLQSIGRGLRLKEGKEKCNLFDISDDLSYKSKMNHTLRHFKDRVNLYSQEEFEFSMITVRLDHG